MDVGSHFDYQVLNHSELKNVIDAGTVCYPKACVWTGRYNRTSDSL